jgi:lysozyme family protein
MADFKQALKKTLGIEGFYSNDLTDRGAETYKGISRKNNADWHGWIVIDEHKNLPGFPKTLETDEHLQQYVSDLYKERYWDKVAGDFITSQEVAEELFDIAVNMGVKTAVLFLQGSINLLNRNQKLYADIDADGIIGIKTYSTLNKFCNEKSVLKSLNGFQFERYKEICEKDPTQEKYFEGWLQRV